MKEKFKYLYLDDNEKVTRDGDVEFMNAYSKRIEIATDYPGSWAQRAKQILAGITTIDGIILDWELTNKSEQAKLGADQAEDVDFSAESLAEHLRISVVTNSIKAIPIILCSADKNKTFSQLKNKELSTSTLFDMTYIKSDLLDKNATKSEAELYDLAYVYETLQTCDLTLPKILNIKMEEIEVLDIRFTDSLSIILSTRTTHDLVNFLLNNLILREGILINELVLAARLGIDISSCADEWEKLIELLVKSGIKYCGLLSIAWNNFWAFKLEEFWEKNFPTTDLRTTGAPAKVLLLNTKFNLKLVNAQKIKFCSSDEFWTICQGLKRPLDPANGFIISEGSRNPWLEEEYVSGIAELEKEDKNAWRINIMDRDRYLHFKKIVTKS